MFGIRSASCRVYSGKERDKISGGVQMCKYLTIETKSIESPRQFLVRPECLPRIRLPSQNFFRARPCHRILPGISLQAALENLHHVLVRRKRQCLLACHQRFLFPVQLGIGHGKQLLAAKL